MGLLVSEVLERSRDEIFEAGAADRPIWDTQSGSINDTSTTLTLTGRETYTPPDTVVEWDDNSMELADVYSTSGTTVTLQTRGYLESTAASHTAGTRLWLDHPYPKIVLFNALKAVIGSLYGLGIYYKNNSAGTLTLNTITPVSLPTGARDVVGDIWAYDGINYYPVSRSQFDVIYAFTPPKVQFSASLPWNGRAIYFDYKKDFTLPTALTDDLDTLGIPTTLQPHMAKGLAGYVLMGRDVPALETEYTRPDPQQPGQPGTRASIGRLLWGTFLEAVSSERNRLLESHPTAITY